LSKNGVRGFVSVESRVVVVVVSTEYNEMALKVPSQYPTEMDKRKIRRRVDLN